MPVQGLSSLKRKVKGIRRNLRDNVEEAVEDGVERTADAARIELQNSNQIWTGQLAASIGTSDRTTPDGKRFKVAARVPYAAYVEFGTGARGDETAPPHLDFDAPAHTPMLTEDIHEWVSTKATFHSGFYPKEWSEYEIAYAIAHSIADKGTHAHPYMRPAWFETKPLLMQDVRKALRHTVRRS